MPGRWWSMMLGKVTSGRMGPHTLLQVSGLQGDIVNTIALLLPYGYTANPAPGSDVALIPVLGSNDHQIAIGGGLSGSAVSDLAAGEFGLAMNGQSVIFRNGGTVQITGASEIDVVAPAVNITAATVTITGNLAVTGGTISVGGTPLTVP